VTGLRYGQWVREVKNVMQEVLQCIIVLALALAPAPALTAICVQRSAFGLLLRFQDFKAPVSFRYSSGNHYIRFQVLQVYWIISVEFDSRVRQSTLQTNPDMIQDDRLFAEQR
jgi:hypothetical protein